MTITVIGATGKVALGSIGLEGNLARLAILAAGRAVLSRFVRLSVLNTWPTSLGINRRAHWSVDFAAAAAGIPYATVRPAIFSASLLAAGPGIRVGRTWTGLADGLHRRRQERHAGLQLARTCTPTWPPPKERPGQGFRGSRRGSPERSGS